MDTIVKLANGDIVTHKNVSGYQGLNGTPFLAILNQDEPPRHIALYNIEQVVSVTTPEMDRPPSSIVKPQLVAISSRN